MNNKKSRLSSFLHAQQRTMITVVVAAMLANGLVIVSRSLDETDSNLTGSSSGIDTQNPSTFDGGADSNIAAGSNTDPNQGGSTPTIPSGGTGTNTGNGTKPKPGNGNGNGNGTGPGTGNGGTNSPTPTQSPTISAPAQIGVTDDEIKVVYYWKGERTMTSPHVSGTGAEGQNLDESLAFERYIEYINKHSGDGSTFFGIPINLHGRKLVGEVVDAGNGDGQYGPSAERIAEEIKPFAAIAAHGSLSSYICPRLAESGIHNMQTYDLGGKGGNLVQRTNGYCIPSGLTWERQIDLTAGYLSKHKLTKSSIQGQDRVYGVIYSEYPGLEDVAGAMIEKLKAAGIPIKEVGTLPPDLANAQSQAPGILARMRNSGVNTLIMPDAGSPMTITHAAQANQYYPDYYVWPCSGEDTTGMVRLFNPAQWARAEGLTCYDHEFNPDLTNNNKARDTEWWKAYQEISGPDKEPPSSSPLVYAGLFQLVAGLSLAGPELTTATFRAGLDAVATFRYDSVDGKTKDPTNMLITINQPDRSTIGDAAYLKWDASAREPGSSTAGAYVYPEDKRYSKRSSF